MYQVQTIYPKVQGNPVDTSTTGPKKLAAITGWPYLFIINKAFFTRKCMVVFARQPKKVAVRQGSTVSGFQSVSPLQNILDK